MLLVAEPSTTNISPTEANVDEYCCNGDGVHPTTTCWGWLMPKSDNLKFLSSQICSFSLGSKAQVLYTILSRFNKSKLIQ